MEKESIFPVSLVVDDVLDSIEKKTLTVLQAPPGSGKSTVLPLHFLENHSPKQQVWLVQPRRLAAKSVAERLAFSLGETVGESVGYSVRFENKAGNKTKLLVVTEGVLLQKLQADPFLENVELIVFDEFHERSLNSDLSLALARYVQKHLKPELKMLLMSATLDVAKMKTKLPDAAFVEAQGRMFPVKVFHNEKYVSRNWFEVFVDQVVFAFKNHDSGHLLGFLPGRAEIFKAKEQIEKRISTEIFPLYGEMNLEDQKKAISKSDRRKIILATNVAETSLTIEGVTIVVDSGLQRKAVFDQGLGLQKLETVFIAREKAIQRQGRAGRTAHGYCYKCWSFGQEHEMAEHEKPEILTAELSNALLILANWGSVKIKDYEWLDEMPEKNVAYAQETLAMLGALSDGKITNEGKKMAALPLPVRLSNMVIRSIEKNLGHMAVDLAAILEEKDFLPESLTTDLEFRLAQLHAFRKKQPFEGNRGLIERVSMAAEKLRADLSITSKNEDWEQCDWVLSNAFPERIAKPMDGNGKFKMANGHVVMLPKTEQYLKNNEWLVVASYQTGAQQGLVNLACQTKPENHHEKTETALNNFWDEDSHWFKTEKVTYVAGLEWKKQHTQEQSNELVSALLKVIEEKGFGVLGFGTHDEQLWARVHSLAIWNPEDHWPNLNFESMKETLTSFLEAVRKKEDLKRIEIKTLVEAFLGWEKQQLLERLAPEKLKMPSGFDVPLEYDNQGNLPVLKVKMQEIFGMAQNPKVNDGKTEVIVHLLSPRGIPVQITKDLMSFWKNTYHLVVKELRMNYPKHFWPENPLEAPAIRGTKRQNGLI